MSIETNELISRIMAIYCDSVSSLSDRWLDQGSDLSIVLKLLRPLEDLAEELRESNSDARRVILDAVYSVQEYVYHERGDHAAVVERCRRGMDVTDGTAVSHYLFASGMARAYFALGQAEKGFAVLGNAIDQAIACGVAKVEAPGMCHMATTGDLNRAKSVPDFVSAVTRFAEVCGVSGTEFRSRWASDSRAALLRLCKK